MHGSALVGNMGVTVPDKGMGGKYLVLPPGYTRQDPCRLLSAETADGIKENQETSCFFLRRLIARGWRQPWKNTSLRLERSTH